MPNPENGVAYHHIYMLDDTELYDFSKNIQTYIKKYMLSPIMHIPRVTALSYLI